MKGYSCLDAPWESLDRWTVSKNASLGELVATACLLEASAPKAGNVHPGAAFVDMNYEDFRQSARSIGQVFDQLNIDSIGTLIWSAIDANAREVGKNTNLGIVLLMAPLVIAAKKIPRRQLGSSSNEWRSQVAMELDALTAHDSKMIYHAIARAKPGGLGNRDEWDVKQPAPQHLLEAMRIAADWDDIAREYATGFADVFQLSQDLDRYRKRNRQGWLHALPSVHVQRIASHGDSLIARKNNQDVVDRVKELANKIVASGSLPSTCLTEQADWREFDKYLRADGHRRNPGTTADLLAAATFVCLINEQSLLESPV